MLPGIDPPAPFSWLFQDDGAFYAVVSGWLADIPLIAGLFVAYRHLSCHHAPCHRLSFHTTPDGLRLCKTHVALPKSDLDLHDIHEDHQR